MSKFFLRNRILNTNKREPKTTMAQALEQADIKRRQEGFEGTESINQLNKPEDDIERMQLQTRVSTQPNLEAIGRAVDESYGAEDSAQDVIVTPDFIRTPGQGVNQLQESRKFVRDAEEQNINTKEAVISELAARGVQVPDGEGNLRISNDINDARRLYEQDEELQKQLLPTYLKNNADFNFKSQEDMIQQLSLDVNNKDAVNVLYQSNNLLNKQLKEDMAVTLKNERNDDTLSRLINLLSVTSTDRNGTELPPIIDPTTRVPSNRLGGALALAFIESIQQQMFTEESSLTTNYNQKQNPGPRVNTAQVTDDPEEADKNLRRISGQLYNPDYRQGNLARSVLDKLMPAENRTGEVVLGPSTGTTADPALVDLLDHILWNTVLNSRYIEVIKGVTDQNTGQPVDTFYRLSDRAVQLYRKGRDILASVQPDKRIFPSLVPLTEGMPIASEDLANPKMKSTSVKSKKNQNTLIKKVTKDIMGRMPYTINDDMARLGTWIVRSQLLTDPTDKFVTQLRMQANDGFYSMSEWAETLGLGKDKWLDAKQNAIINQSADEEDANLQADRVMRQKAKQILQELKDIEAFKGKKFYMKIFDSASVGRFFIRNNVLNPIDSKFVRNILVDANPLLINTNPESEKERKLLLSWKELVSRNLLLPDETRQGIRVRKIDTKLTPEEAVTGIMKDDGTGPLPADRMKPGDLRRRANDIFAQGLTSGNAIYNKWVTAGKAIRDIMERIPAANAPAFRARNEDGSLAQDPIGQDGLQDLTDVMNQFMDRGGSVTEFRKPDSWGTVFQSLIDIANFHDAAKQGSNNKRFKSLANGQKDGVQSGIAIQAWQFGQEDILKLVGVITSNSDNALPEGDVRDLFMKNMLGMYKSLWAGNQEKSRLWGEVFAGLVTDDDYSGIKKALSRGPLMETAYGRGAFFNQQIVKKFLSKEKHSEILEIAKKNSGLAAYPDAELLEDLNLLIGKTLINTLDFTHQRVMSDLGKLWAITGATPSLQGPDGSTYFIGDMELVDADERPARIQLYSKGARGIASEVSDVDLQRKTFAATGSKRKAQKQIYDPEQNKFSEGTEPTAGQGVANSIPVVTIINIDGSILSLSTNSVNKGLKIPLFAMFIHDSFITNARGFAEYSEEFNKKFQSVNARYPVFQSLINAFSRDLKDWENNLVDDNKYKFGPNIPGLNVMYDILKSAALITEKDKPYREKDVNNKLESSDRGSANKMLNSARKIIGFKIDFLNDEVSSLTGKQIKNLYQMIARDRYRIYTRIKQQQEIVSNGAIRKQLTKILNYI